jgi:hypothetical protein
MSEIAYELNGTVLSNMIIEIGSIIGSDISIKSLKRKT